MRGIRIWHLAALALSVPLLAAAVPSGCTGGLNPNFRNAIGQGASTAIPIPTGYILVGIFNETGLTGHADFTVAGKWPSPTNPNPTTWAIPFGIDVPLGVTFTCDLTSLTPAGGEVFVPDPTTGVLAPTTINYTGGTLAGIRIGDPLECGTLVKLSIVPVGAGYSMFVDLLK